MRIAYLTQSYPPMISGASIAVEQLASEMAHCGHQVLVIAASDRKQSYVLRQNNLTIYRLKSIRNPMRVGQRFTLYLRAEVLTTLAEFKPDVIHGHEPLLNWIGFEYARRMNIPTTLTMHMLPWSVPGFLPRQRGLLDLAEKASWLYLRMFAQNFTSIITTTKTASRVITKTTGLRSETIPCGIDTQTFHPRSNSDVDCAVRSRLNLPADVPIILHVGRLDSEKNVEYILQAAASTLRQSDAHLLVVGDGREKKSLMKLSQSLGIADRTHFSGYLSVHDGLPDVYRISTLFVMTSEIESQGLVLLEAAASGLPLVAVDATSIAEIVHDDVNGYLVQPGDVSALANAMVKILNDPNKATQMGRESVKLSKHYDIQRVQALHEQYYEKLIRQQAALKHYPKTSWKRLKTWIGISE